MPRQEIIGDVVTVVCGRCRQNYTTPAVRIGATGRLMRTTRFCLLCAEVEAAQATSDASSAETRARRDRFREDCPPLYRSLMMRPDFRADLHAAIAAADMVAARRGVLVTGPTGHWKTTASWRYLADLYAAGIFARWNTGPGLRVDVAAAWRDGTIKPMAAIYAKTPVLFLDDLGQAADSEAASEFLFDLIEARTSERLPTLVTMQYSSAEFAALFKNQTRAKALVRRLGDYFTHIPA